MYGQIKPSLACYGALPNYPGSRILCLEASNPSTLIPDTLSLSSNPLQRETISSLEIRRIHIEARQTSGMSQAAYCREHGLNAKTFGNWLRIYRNGCEVARSSALVPVTIKPMSMPANTLRLRQPRVIMCWNTAIDGFAALAGELLKCV